MAGIVFAKFTKPTMRAETILFRCPVIFTSNPFCISLSVHISTHASNNPVFYSKNALICLRNGSFYLCCRIGDLRLALEFFQNLDSYVNNVVVVDLLICMVGIQKWSLMILIAVKGPCQLDQFLTSSFFFLGQHICWNHMCQGKW